MTLRICFLATSWHMERRHYDSRPGSTTPIKRPLALGCPCRLPDRAASSHGPGDSAIDRRLLPEGDGVGRKAPNAESSRLGNPFHRKVLERSPGKASAKPSARRYAARSSPAKRNV